VKDRINFIISGSEVTRYHTVRTLTEETVGHHSHMVAMLCILLTEEGFPSSELLMGALVHDLAEHQTGDIPSPAKREYGIGEQVSELEERLLRSACLDVELSKKEARTLKMADLAQGALFCVRELQLGNRLASVVYDRYMSYAESLVLSGRELELFNTIRKFREEIK